MNIDLNCDMGEGFSIYSAAPETDLMPLITSANLACGFHAGDPVIMAQTVRLAKAHGVAVGAQPGYPDLQGFGRRKLDMTTDEIEAMILYQIGALYAIARAEGVELTHVKPHGALYNVAAAEAPVAAAIAHAVARFSRDLIFVALATSAVMVGAGEAAGLRVAREAFADRAYNADGSLRSRKLPGAVHNDPIVAAAQAVSIARDHMLTAYDGTHVALQADTLCLHGDNPAALNIATALNQTLPAAGVTLCRMFT